MKLQQMMSLVRQAVDEYGMIEEGDQIAVGISGGKDSLALLQVLKGLQRFYPKSFELTALTVDLGFGSFPPEEIREYCQKLQVPYEIIHTEIADVIKEKNQQDNPCSLCAKLRKGAFNDRAKALGCNKIAYAHHKDDVVETMLLSLVYEGRFHTFSPVTYLDETGLTVIRPLIFVREADIIGFQHKYGLPVAKNPCPADGKTKREEASLLLKEINRMAPGVRNRMFTAIRRHPLPGWATDELQKS